MSKDLNEKHRIATISIENTKVDVFLLNPGSAFEGFGGSSSALPVRKTASLITRTRTVHGWSDREYNLADRQAWAWLFWLTQQEKATVETPEPFRLVD
jgi:hypothetical protein